MTTPEDVRQIMFDSSSSDGLFYTVELNTKTGESSCNCPGWTFKRSGKERSCKHTRIAARGNDEMPKRSTPKRDRVGRIITSYSVDDDGYHVCGKCEWPNYAVVQICRKCGARMRAKVKRRKRVVKLPLAKYEHARQKASESLTNLKRAMTIYSKWQAKLERAQSELDFSLRERERDVDGSQRGARRIVLQKGVAA